MPETDTDQLLTFAQSGDSVALEKLLTRYRDRLRRMINVFLDPRVSARIDPSDVLQEALTCAATRLPSYLEKRPIAFYPWLRQIVREQLIQVHRQHVQAERRSVRRERRLGAEISDASAMQLAERLVSSGTSPSQKMDAEEMKSKLKAALAELPETDRELLLMRCVEQLSIGEITAVLGISETAAKSRLRRGLQKLNRLLAT